MFKIGQCPFRAGNFMLLKHFMRIVMNYVNRTADDVLLSLLALKEHFDLPD